MDIKRFIGQPIDLVRNELENQNWILTTKGSCYHWIFENKLFGFSIDLSTYLSPENVEEITDAKMYDHQQIYWSLDDLMESDDFIEHLKKIKSEFN